MSKIIGIDLGTTNSEVAVVINGKPQLIPDGNQRLIPSVVGLSPEGELLVGQAAKNQYVLYPERTVKSIKRKMGSKETVRLGDYDYTPQEISAFILKKLKKVAEDFLVEPVEKAVITVPAYFSEAQRQATKDAGEIAGLEVVRIINEPTAAALAYGADKEEDHIVMVYDLGGGTFDVSIVEINSGVVEVKASHGNNHLGGDDFDEKIIDHLVSEFLKSSQVDLKKDPKSLARIYKAAEAAKIKLSSHPFASIQEEFIAKRDSGPLHLKNELSRQKFTTMIESLVRSTEASMELSLNDAELKPKDIHKVLMVGGSTRIPLVWDVVYNKMEQEPRSEINPDECVALGAAIQAGIIAGEEVDAVLVDVTPYSLGMAVMEYKFGDWYDDRFSIVIRRNTVIPVSKSEVYYTMHPQQTKAKVDVYQGEHKTASENVLLGSFLFENIPPSRDESEAEFIIQFDLDVDGLLHVSAMHKDTGRKEQISIKTSQAKLSEQEKQDATAKIASFKLAEDGEVMPLVKKAKKLLKTLPDSEGKAELAEILDDLEAAVKEGERQIVEDLKETLLDKMFELE